MTICSKSLTVIGFLEMDDFPHVLSKPSMTFLTRLELQGSANPATLCAHEMLLVVLLTFDSDGFVRYK